MTVEWRTRYDELRTAQGSMPEPERVDRLFALAWEQGLADSPESATFFGAGGEHTAWTDLSPDAVEARRDDAGLALHVARTIDAGALDEERRLSLDLFVALQESRVELARFPADLLQVSPIDGVHQYPAMVLGAQPLSSARERLAYAVRVGNLAAHVDQATDLLRDGLRTGVTHPAAALGAVPTQIAAMCVPPPEHPLLEPLRATDDEEALHYAEDRLVDDVIPAYQRLQMFVADEYLPGARTTTAWTALPDGDAWYGARVRHHTTTDHTPQEIHEIGLAEVARIRAEMEAVVEEAGFGDRGFEAYADHLRTDPSYRFDTPEALVDGYRALCKRIDPQLPRLFGRLPRLPYGVDPVPAHSEQGQTTAYYLPGAPAAGRPGVFFANTWDLAARPNWEMEALALHEAVPGHHLQIALAQELDGLPDFRTKSWSGFTAYVEGWGLYSEALGHELGCYRDPTARFGRLSFEMWRAIRLVVDTGMHALGWSRQQAIDLFTANTGKPRTDIVVEVDRYLVYAGQALAYKLGELAIRGLRAEAERAHGDGFDVRAFHDLVLGSGPLPLAVLERRVRGWIAGDGR